jgi:hypothetical protein
MVVVVVEGTGGAVVVVVGGVGASAVAFRVAAVFDAPGADVVVEAGAEVVVVTDPVLLVFPPAVGVVEES